MRELLRDSTFLAQVASIGTLIVECGALSALLATQNQECPMYSSGHYST